MEIRLPKTKSDFDKYFDFRWRMLREPWQQPRGSEQDELEDESFHVMAVNEDDAVIAVGRIHFLENKSAQIRYMAVAESYQNQGLGQQILTTLEQHACSNKVNSIMLHAREPALPFYKNQGYRVIRKSHVLFGCIQHYEMNKELDCDEGQLSN